MRTAILLFVLLLPGLLYAEAPAIDTNTGKTVSIDEVILSGKKNSRFLTDSKNLRIELGPSASAIFDKDGNFRLLRGSAILSSASERIFSTVNAKVKFIGKLVASYDYREESSSAFVVYGSASIESANTEQSARQLKRLEGATLIAKEQYPNLLRNLSFSQADSWLNRYGWPSVRRSEILAGLPEKTDVASETNTGPGIPVDESTATRELASYFPTEKEAEGPRVYEKTFSNSAMRGKEFGEVEQKLASGDEIQIIAPEEAAVIVLPEIDLGPGIRLSAQREGTSPKTRKPASLNKV
jgi:hypothetical protein